MVKVETFIEINMRMTLAEARELHEVLGKTTGAAAWMHFDALDDALKLLRGSEVKA